MGYQSNIVIAITKEEYTKAFLKKNFPDILKEEKHKEENEIFYWYLEGWKWYSSYPEIIEINKYLDSIEDQDTYGFIRLGEEWGDVETMGNPYDLDLECYQYISTPVHGKSK